MIKYHKIHTLFKREIDKGGRRKGKIIEGEWALPEFEYLCDNQWTFQEKLDGTNIRIGWNGIKREICGRTDNASIPAKLFGKLIELFPENKLENVFPKEGKDNLDITLFGEGLGASIQKGGENYCKDQTFVLFDILINGWWLRYPDVCDIGTKLGIDVASMLGEGTLYGAVEMARKGFKSRLGNRDFDAEGIVLRPKVELKARDDSRIIGKIKLKDF